MLSPSSVAAISSSVAQLGVGRANPVSRARTAVGQTVPPNQPTVPALTAPQGRDVPNQPGQPLPRGSLLDLSV